MTGPTLSVRDRRVLVFGGMIVLAIAVLGRGVPALRAHAVEQRARAADAVHRAARAEWQARHAHEMQHALRQTRLRLAAYDSALVRGATPSEASASLAELVSDAVDGTDARLGSIQLGADSAGTPGALARVTAHASVSGELMSIALVLAALEQGPQLLAVRELSIGGAQPNLARNQREQLQAELVVDGLYRRAAAGRAR
jgi:hypothetical protein